MTEQQAEAQPQQMTLDQAQFILNRYKQNAAEQYAGMLEKISVMELNLEMLAQQNQQLQAQLEQAGAPKMAPQPQDHLAPEGVPRQPKPPRKR